MICGKQEGFEVFGFQEGDDFLIFSEKIKSSVFRYLEQSIEVVCIVDMFGATPFNSSAVALAETNCLLVSGVNLPLLLELVTQRGFVSDYKRLIESSLESARESLSITDISEMFKKGE